MNTPPPFQNPELFQQAMTHKSYAKEYPNAGSDNERLEFLGDAILTFLCGEFLFARYPEKSEGELTPLRASLVDATQLGKFAQQLCLQKDLRLGRGVEGSGGRQNARLLSSAFEAMVGAYFLDQRSRIDPVRKVVFPLFESVVELLADPTHNINEKSALQEWALAQVLPIPTYIIVTEAGPDHAKEFTAEVWIDTTMYGQGKGRRKQDAEKAAARDALRRLGLL
ncbi:ribonuclease III [Oscillatoria sp. CS-180]|uniref:ribonuclease III n=1 Tax=Oscillatoria sp. CS-180 TaxID=3021720 RepID=UPI00232C2AD3|nr:ribonuclease III [Oscillatoria sp. CS-180]MDB9529833.1 ribonuclease III [Oscillatoria sp. CS-180]